MKKTIVSIISEQTIPNYLFIKDVMKDGDRLLMITSSKVRNRIDWILDTLKVDRSSVQIQAIDEESWASMVEGTKAILDFNTEYHVNLTGGTKYMSLAMFQVFSALNSWFYYIPYPKNSYYRFSSQEGVNLSTPIKTRLTVQEYFSNYHVPIKKGALFFENSMYCKKMMQFFCKDGFLTKEDREIIEKLRSYRNSNIRINAIETKVHDEKKPQIKGLRSFLNKIEYPLSDVDALTKYDTRFLTGGWYEEYVYDLIKTRIQPQDIAIGVTVENSETTGQNDLDVVFTLGNKLFVVECKTGIAGEKMFKETVYKATALKEILLGLSGNSYIFSLNQDPDEKTKKTAKNMGITYYDRPFFLSEEKFEMIVNDIRNRAQD